MKKSNPKKTIKTEDEEAQTGINLTGWLKENGLSDINSPAKEGVHKGMTPLCVAIEQNNLSIIGLLLKKTESHNNPCTEGPYEGVTPLCYAIIKNRKKIVEQIVNRLKMNNQTIQLSEKLQAGIHKGKTPRELAQEQENKSILDILDKALLVSNPSELADQLNNVFDLLKLTNAIPEETLNEHREKIANIGRKYKQLTNPKKPSEILKDSAPEELALSPIMIEIN